MTAKNAVFIAGTDTGVGKTQISLGLMALLQALGLRVSGMKPVASGGFTTEEGLRNDDAVFLSEQSSDKPDYSDTNPYAFEPPIAPYFAASEAGRAIDAGHICESLRRLQANNDLVVVEGVGGWRMPLMDDLQLADIVKTKDMPVILVVGMRLGCINHAILTAEAILNDGIKLIGWIANSIDIGYDRLDESCDGITRWLDVPLLGRIPYQQDLKVEQIAAQLDMEKLRLSLDIKSNVS
jgi:dethiobiotin synthetase